MNPFFEETGLQPFVCLYCYERDSATRTAMVRVPLTDSLLVHDNIRIRVQTELFPVPDTPDAVRITATFTAETPAESVAVGLEFVDANWSKANYVLIPGAAYNGNRFEARVCAYPPMFTEETDLHRERETTITDVPRLERGAGPSRLQILARDAVTPAMGYFAPGRDQSIFLLMDERTSVGATGLYITESEDTDRSAATLSIAAPGVREGKRYEGNQVRKPSEDRGATLAAGDQIVLRVQVHRFPCATIPELFERFAGVRKALSGEPTLAMELPFGSAWAIQEEKYNRENWRRVKENAAGGYYAVGTGPSKYDDFQVGWVGGAINTYPLLLRGNATSQDRAKQTLDWFFAEGQAESGYFKSVYFRGQWYDDGFEKAPPGTDFHLIRKSADALYFLLKQFDLLQKRGDQVPPEWEAGARRCADAFVRTWEQFGEWGQFVSEHTGDIWIRNSAAAGIAPAALSLAADYFGRPDYQTIAENGARYLGKMFTRRGVTTGGPGEILQCPDSESAYGLLESFVVLYEATSETQWLTLAKDAAYQCATWHVSYDYRYPPRSEFGRHQLWSGGSVLANVQNKHSAPGICTLSGDSLWKLFRATGDLFYLTLLQETARNLTQYLSRSDRPIHDLKGTVLPPGYMNERVNLSDWDNNIGGVFHGSCWCEVSLMLTFAQVPGVYVQPDTGLCVAMDHVEATLVSTSADGAATVRLHNPTDYPAQVALWCETSQIARTRPLGQNALSPVPLIGVAPGETVETAVAAR